MVKLAIFGQTKKILKKEKYKSAHYSTKTQTKNLNCFFYSCTIDTGKAAKNKRVN